MGRWIAELKKRENAGYGHCQNRQNPSKEGFGSFGSSSVGQIRELLSPDANDLWVQYEERAAILEYDGGHSRSDAERVARVEVFGSTALSDDQIDALIEVSPLQREAQAGRCMATAILARTSIRPWDGRQFHTRFRDKGKDNMGGIGSGNRLRVGVQPKCESLVDLRLSDLRKHGLLEPGRRAHLTWTTDGRPSDSIGIVARETCLELVYRVANRGWRPVVEHVVFDLTTQHFGGERRWFVCPSCLRRCAVLYAGDRFRCRLCLNLAYRSQSQGAADRRLFRAQKLRQQLGGPANMLLPLPEKPKGMHWSTYDRLLAKSLTFERKGIQALSKVCASWCAATFRRARAGSRSREG